MSSVNSFLANGDFRHLLIAFANILDPDQDQQNIGPDLDPNCLVGTLNHKKTNKNKTRMQEGVIYLCQGTLKVFSCKTVDQNTGLDKQIFSA